MVEFSHKTEKKQEWPVTLQVANNVPTTVIKLHQNYF